VSADIAANVALVGRSVLCAGEHSVACCACDAV